MDTAQWPQVDRSISLGLLVFNSVHKAVIFFLFLASSFSRCLLGTFFGKKRWWCSWLVCLSPHLFGFSSYQFFNMYFTLSFSFVYMIKEKNPFFSFLSVKAANLFCFACFVCLFNFWSFLDLEVLVFFFSLCLFSFFPFVCYCLSTGDCGETNRRDNLQHMSKACKFRKESKASERTSPKLSKVQFN